MLTRTSPFARRNRCRAASLVELLVAIAVGGIIAGALMTLSLYSSKTLAGLGNYLDLEQQSRQTLDQLSRDVRSAAAVTALTTNRLTVVTTTGATITYDYSAANRTLDRLQGSWRTVLRECDTLKFALENPKATGAVKYQDWVAASSTNGKVLSVSWTCSRTLLGSKVNTEAGQSARIVIRNAP